MRRGSLKNCSISFQFNMCSHLQMFDGMPQSSPSNLTVSFLLPALLLSLGGGNFPCSYKVQSCDVGVFAFFAAKGPKHVSTSEHCFVWANLFCSAGPCLVTSLSLAECLTEWLSDLYSDASNETSLCRQHATGLYRFPQKKMVKGGKLGLDRL